jgi:hypothetical protein
MKYRFLQWPTYPTVPAFCRGALWLFALSALMAQPAHATASLACSIADRSLHLDLQSAVGRGAGEVISNVRGELQSKLKDIPDDLRKVEFENSHLTQSWLYGRDLRLRLYRERSGEGQHGYVELIIQTRRTGKDDEAPHVGTYEIEVYFIPTAGSEGRTLKARGRAKCLVG